MVMTYSDNPFADLKPQKERYRRPPVIELGMRTFEVSLYWGPKQLATEETAGVWQSLQEQGVDGKAILKGNDGTGYYARIYSGENRVDLALSGFTHDPFEKKPNGKETIMDNTTVLEKYKKHIAEKYEDDTATMQQVAASLAECPTFATVNTYLQSFWDKKAIGLLQEEFFQLRVKACWD